MSPADAIERYLRTGQHEHDHPEWPGQNIWEKAKNGHDDLVRALVNAVTRRSEGHQHEAVPSLDLASWTRQKLTPMVWGLFPQVEREAVLALLEKSVVFLTSDNIERVLLQQTWLSSAWDLANLYLGSLDADLLGPEAPSLLGLSQETTCYVSADYFTDRGKVEDFVIHEAAHVFHNCKRKTAGLRETRTREWLQDIEFRKRETFAYSCEGYGAILERAKGKNERLAMVEKFVKEVEALGEDCFEPTELRSLLREACEARNGWKVILGRCAPAKTTRARAVDELVGERP